MGRSRTHGHGASEDTIHLQFREALAEEGSLGLEASSNIISMGIGDVHEEESPGGDKLEEQSGAGRLLRRFPLGLDQRQ